MRTLSEPCTLESSLGQDVVRVLYLHNFVSFFMNFGFLPFVKKKKKTDDEEDPYPFQLM